MTAVTVEQFVRENSGTLGFAATADVIEQLELSISSDPAGDPAVGSDENGARLYKPEYLKLATLVTTAGVLERLLGKGSGIRFLTGVLSPAAA